jgi:hypothetical protein
MTISTYVVRNLNHKRFIKNFSVFITHPRQDGSGSVKEVFSNMISCPIAINLHLGVYNEIYLEILGFGIGFELGF